MSAAGLVGVARPNASAFEKFVGALKDNATWLIATGVGLVLIGIPAALA